MQATCSGLAVNCSLSRMSISQRVTNVKEKRERDEKRAINVKFK